MTILAIAAALLGNQAGFNPYKALERLAPLMVSHKQPMTNEQFTKVLAKAGCQAKFDEKTKKQYPGFPMHTYDHVGPVEGLDRGSIVCVEVISSIRECGYSMLVSFYQKGGKARFTIIDGNDTMDIINPYSAVFVDGRLIVSCLDNLIGTHPTVTFITYKKDKGEWKYVRHATTNYRSYRAPILKLSADGKHIQPVRFRCETYPFSFETGHVAANVPYTEQWSFPNNRPKRDWRRVNDSPYHSVDLLVRALKRKNVAEIKRQCFDKSISKTLLSHLKEDLRDLRPQRYDWSRKIREWDSFLVEEWKLVLHYRRFQGRWVVGKLTPYRSRKWRSNPSPAASPSDWAGMIAGLRPSLQPDHPSASRAER